MVSSQLSFYFFLILFIYIFMSHTTWHVGPYFPNYGLNPCSLNWKCRVLTLDHQGSQPALILQMRKLKFSQGPHQVLGFLRQLSSLPHLSPWCRAEVCKDCSGAANLTPFSSRREPQCSWEFWHCLGPSDTPLFVFHTVLLLLWFLTNLVHMDQFQKAAGHAQYMNPS